MAARIIENAKCSRPSVCNAAETLLVDRAVAQDFLPLAAQALSAHGCVLRGCPETCAILPAAEPAAEADWDTEYNAPVISIAVVDTLEDAIEHIETHGSHHTDAIITDSRRASDTFLRAVDSGSVMVNCSTRLADGFVYGLGAEIGISTGKLHARGPVGLEGLTNLKYIVLGNGECRH